MKDEGYKYPRLIVYKAVQRGERVKVVWRGRSIFGVKETGYLHKLVQRVTYEFVKRRELNSASIEVCLCNHAKVNST